jgi:hypothetical protein
MSFEVFLQCFDSCEPAGIPRAAVRWMFPVVDDESEADYWLIRYNDLNSCHIGVRAIPSDADLLHSLCVVRPCVHSRLWEALLATMRLGHVVLYFPGGQRPLVADEDTAAHLPPDLTESFGLPQLAWIMHRAL